MVRMERLTIAVCISSAAPMARITAETISALLWAARSRTVKEAVEDARRIKRVKRSLRYECFRADVASVEAQRTVYINLAIYLHENNCCIAVCTARSHSKILHGSQQSGRTTAYRRQRHVRLYGEQSKLGSPSLKTIWVALHRISPPLHFYHLSTHAHDFQQVILLVLRLLNAPNNADPAKDVPMGRRESAETGSIEKPSPSTEVEDNIAMVG